MRLLVAITLISLGCTKPNPAATCPDGTCSDPAFPFCDVTGAISGTPNQCLSVECTPGELEACSGSTAVTCAASGDAFDVVECGAGCDPASGCLPFCTPNAVMGCSGGALTSCNAAGTATINETCALGCANDETRCLTFEPLNGLAPALADSANEADITLPVGTRVDTALGLVQDANGTTIAVKVDQVPQVGDPPIIVIEAGSFSIADLTITGTAPLAIVAKGTISISGRINVRAVGPTAGAGARTTGSCLGGNAQQFSAICPQVHSVGAGGGGNHQAGGRGGAASNNAGGVLNGFTPLAGGCGGGSQRNEAGSALVSLGGGGGGALQVVSGTRVMLSGLGLINVGGGGGQSTAGGGSGGLVVIEAPEIAIIGATAGITANGGAGGGCGMTGPDASTTTTPAPGATCANYFAGRGGTATNAPGNGCVIGVDTCDSSNCPVVYGGGGGSVGVVRIATKDGTFSSNGGPILSVHVTAATLNPQ